MTVCVGSLRGARMMPKRGGPFIVLVRRAQFR
jgi:hypothetical protein